MQRERAHLLAQRTVSTICGLWACNQSLQDESSMYRVKKARGREFYAGGLLTTIPAAERPLSITNAETNKRTLLQLTRRSCTVGL